MLKFQTLSENVPLLVQYEECVREMCSFQNWMVGRPGNEASLAGSHTASEQGIGIGTYMYMRGRCGIPLTSSISCYYFALVHNE